MGTKALWGFYITLSLCLRAFVAIISMCLRASAAKKVIRPKKIISFIHYDTYTMEEFHLNGKEYIELNKLLKLVKWVGTGGEAHIHIENGEVLVNGEIETRKRHKLRSGFVIRFADRTVTIV